MIQQYICIFSLFWRIKLLACLLSTRLAHAARLGCFYKNALYKFTVIIIIIIIIIIITASVALKALHYSALFIAASVPFSVCFVPNTFFFALQEYLTDFDDIRSRRWSLSRTD